MRRPPTPADEKSFAVPGRELVLRALATFPAFMTRSPHWHLRPKLQSLGRIRSLRLLDARRIFF
jgi:hypothetical protein